jgi:hypothetical protein
MDIPEIPCAPRFATGTPLFEGRWICNAFGRYYLPVSISPSGEHEFQRLKHLNEGAVGRDFVPQSPHHDGIAHNFPVQLFPLKPLRKGCRRIFVALAGPLLACSPALDWRTTPVSNTALVALFPCKPDDFSRRLSLAGQSQLVTLTSCQAAGLTFAVAAADVQQSHLAPAALAALRQSAEQNFGGTVQLLAPRTLPGADTGAPAQRVSAELVRAEGDPLRAQMLFFSHGPWIFQATVMGTLPTAETVEFFFDNLKLAP